MKKLSAIALATLLGAASSQASVTLAFEFFELRDALGNELNDGSTVAIFADTSGGGVFPSSSSFANQTLTVGNSYEGDELLALGVTITDLGDQGFFTLGAASYDAPNAIPAGTALAIYWFDTTSTTIAVGTDFGSFQNTTAADSDLGAALVRPGDGATVNIAYSDVNAGGNASILDFTADMTVVPEPSGVALLGLGAVAGLFRRRRS